MHIFSSCFLFLLTNVLSKNKKEKLEHCGSHPPGTGIALINPQQTDYFWRKVVNPQHPRHFCLQPGWRLCACTELYGTAVSRWPWNSSLNMVGIFFFFFILYIVQDLLQWFQRLCNCVRCSYERQLFLWLYFPRNASGNAFHRNARTEIALWQCWSFKAFLGAVKIIF